MHISEEHFVKFKVLMKEQVGEKKYNEMTEQQLLESATKLLKLVKIVYRHKDSKVVGAGFAPATVPVSGECSTN